MLRPKATEQVHQKNILQDPDPKEISHKLAGAKYFSKLDAKQGYWAIHLDEEYSLLTSFNTPIGRYKYRRYPFGLKVSQDIF